MLLQLLGAVAAAAAATAHRSFRISADLNAFELDGEAFRFMAGSMHYWRGQPHGRRSDFHTPACSIPFGILQVSI